MHAAKARKKQCQVPYCTVVTCGEVYTSAYLTGPSDTLQASTRAGPRTLPYNGFILNDFEIKNADVCAESTSNSTE